MTKYPQQHYEIPHIPIAVLVMVTIGHLPLTSRGHQWDLTVICMDTSYMFAKLMKEISVEVLCKPTSQAYSLTKEVV